MSFCKKRAEERAQVVKGEDTVLFPEPMHEAGVGVQLVTPAQRVETGRSPGSLATLPSLLDMFKPCLTHITKE